MIPSIHQNAIDLPTCSVHTAHRTTLCCDSGKTVPSSIDRVLEKFRRGKLAHSRQTLSKTIRIFCACATKKHARVDHEEVPPSERAKANGFADWTYACKANHWEIHDRYSCQKTWVDKQSSLKKYYKLWNARKKGMCKGCQGWETRDSPGAAWASVFWTLRVCLAPWCLEENGCESIKS